MSFPSAIIARSPPSLPGRRADRPRIAGIGALLLAGVCVAGCRAEPERASRVPTHPVSGRLLVDGQPAPGAMIKFVNKPTGSRVPTAIVREDGSFQVSYFDQEDGAPVGEYQLLVVWMVPPPEGGLPRDRLQGKYLDPRRPVRTVTVAAGGVALDPIELTTTGASP